MSPNRSYCLASGFAAMGLAAVLTIPSLSSPVLPDATQPAAAELPIELRYVPSDAAAFVYVDAAAIWDHPITKSLRKADPKMANELAASGKDVFGLTPDDVKKVVVFAPKMKDPRESGQFGIVVTFKKDYDKTRIQKGAELILKGEKPKVVAVNDRTVLVLLNLGEAFEKPQKADKAGPLSAAFQSAATGKHAIVGGLTLENLPELLSNDDAPPAFRPFKSIFKATSVTATVDLGKSIDLNVRIKTGSAVQAGECERALGMLLGLVQDACNNGLKEYASEMDPNIKDLMELMKAGIASTKAAKFETLGNETSMSVSVPTSLPFTSGYLAAKGKVQAAAANAQSANNLKQIGLALHNYHDTHNTMPPAAVCDKTGKPLLSWRVLILPYVEENELYKQFKLDEPWDSDNNKKLLAKMPRVYGIPGKGNLLGTDTHYRVFVGNGAAFDWLMGVKLQNITDGTSNTLMCVTADTAVPWTKPDELEFDPTKDMTKLMGLVVNGKAQVLMCDGSVRTLAKIPAKATLHAMITKAGGEVINIDDDK